MGWITVQASTLTALGLLNPAGRCLGIFFHHVYSINSMGLKNDNKFVSDASRGRIAYYKCCMNRGKGLGLRV